MLEPSNPPARGDALTVARRVAHDLRSPLGCISTSAELLQDLAAGADEQIQQLAALVASSASETLRVVARVSLLLKATHMDQGEEVLEPEHMDALLSPRDLAADGVSIRRPDTWPRLTAVEDWLSVAWHELLDNAVRHGGRNIECGWEQLEERQRIRLYIRDDGAGLPTHRSAHAFPAFENLHKEESRCLHGLGLPLVRRLVERMHGNVGYRRTADCRTEFCFVLPAQGREASTASVAGSPGDRFDVRQEDDW